MSRKSSTQPFCPVSTWLRPILALLLAALALQPAPVAYANGTIRYVATTGSNTGNNCTNPASPCQTIAYAVGQAAAGDTVQIAACVYTETPSNPSDDSSIIVAKNLTISGAGAATTTVQPCNMAYFCYDLVFEVRGNATVTIEGLTIRFGGRQPYGGGIQSAGVLTVRDYILRANRADRGGGIAVVGGSLTLYNTKVIDSLSDDSGGSIWLSPGTVANLYDSQVIGGVAMIVTVEDITAEVQRRSETEAIDAERHRIAHEIHDGVVQSLGGTLDIRSAFGQGTELIITLPPIAKEINDTRSTWPRRRRRASSR